MATGAQIDMEALADMVAARVLAGINAPREGQKLLDMKQAASFAGVKVPAIRHWIKTEELPGAAVKRYGRRVWIERKLFEQWLDLRR